MNNAALFFYANQNIKSFPDVLREIQEYISSRYSSLISNDQDKQREQIESYISKYLIDHSLSVKGLSFEELVEKIYHEMVGFSFLTKYLYRNDVEEININQWRDIKITYTNGEILPAKEKFNSPEHSVDVIRRLLHKSGMILDNSQPIVRGHLSNKIRITVFGNGVIDNSKGPAVSIRIVNPQKLGREDFIKHGTATGEILDFLSTCLRYGLSMCVTGATSSGKTTLMSWLLSSIPNDKRIVTIENGTREFDLVKEDEEGNIINNVVHTVTRYSEDKKQNIDQEKLLENALTANPDYICVAEMKGEESFSAQKAARTGHAVITTTHANSCESTYYRMVTLCKMKYDINDNTLYSLVTEAFPIVLFTKKLEDNIRRIMEITECEIQNDGKRVIRTLFRFNIKHNQVVDGQLKIIGSFEKVNNISKSMQKRLLENGMPLNFLDKLLQIDRVKEGEDN
ncbi:UNVERIFIED_CONTAM: pilus assembly protein CpaF [Acetivibrio alkalicellulosi]